MRVLVLGLGLVMMGCGGDDDTDALAAGTGTGGATGAAATLPAEGDWQTTRYALEIDECNQWSPDAQSSYFPEAFAITYEEADFVIDAGALTTTCAVDGTAFTCDQVTTYDENIGYGLDADILVLIDMSGVLIDDRQIDGRSLVTLDCEGNDCSQAAIAFNLEFPCELRMATDAEAL